TEQKRLLARRLPEYSAEWTRAAVLLRWSVPCARRSCNASDITESLLVDIVFVDFDGSDSITTGG
ncbi:MAG: hypothetical protein ACO3FE_15525, partial [Planctomycetaceae bacterium]